MSFSYNSSADLWYQYFIHDDGPQALFLIGFTAGRPALASFGFICNFATVFVTYKEKSLHGMCNLLIALDCFFSLFDNASFHISLVIVLTGIRFIRYEHCFWILFVMVLCGDMAQLVMVLTGMDRLLSVFYPIWYKKRNKTYKTYFLIIYGLLILIYAGYDFWVMFMDLLPSLDVMVQCSGNDFGQTTEWGSLMRYRNLIMSGLLMSIYGLIGLVVNFVPNIKKAVSENNQRLIRSLLFIISLNLIGVAFRSSVQLYFYYFGFPNLFVRRILADTMALWIIVVFSANGPVLYFMSNVYRQKFNQYFPALKKIFKEKNVQQLANSMATQQQSGLPNTNTLINNYTNES